MSQEKIPLTTLFDNSFINLTSQEILQQDAKIVELMECYYCIEFPPTTHKKDYETHVVLKHKKNAYSGLVDLEKNNLKPKGKSWEVRPIFIEPVGGKISYSTSFEDYVDSVVRKNTPYYYQDITENTKFILYHFQRPIFPRTISTHKTKGKQIKVYSLNEIVYEFKKACYIDCKINAFSSIDDPIPDFIFIDVDKNASVNIDIALKRTLKNIKDKLDSICPTVLWTGNGYHIYQPIDSLRLENIADFTFVDNPSNKFLRFAKNFLSDGYADQINYPSLKSCFIRVPGSFNSKCLIKGLTLEISPVKILQKWDGIRPSILNLIGSFYSSLIANKIEEDKKTPLSNKSAKFNNQKNITNKINWIEKLLKIPLKDHRKYCLWRIFIPYLINIQGLSENEVISILTEWLDKCNKLNKVRWKYPQRIKEQLKYDKGYPPISFENLKKENFELYELLQD